MVRMRLLQRVAIGMIILIGTCIGAEAKTVTYVGSSTIGNLLNEAKEPFKAKTGIDLLIDISSESAGGEAAAIVGSADLGGVARDLRPETLAHGVICHVIGRDAIAVIVNHKNPIKALSRDQIKAIFTGRITNWEALGWMNRNIVALITAEQSATRQVFQKVMLNGEAYRNVVSPSVDRLVPEWVAGDEDAIGQISFSFIANNPMIRAISIDRLTSTVTNPRYPIASPLYLCTKGEPTGNARRLIDWILSPEGQDLVKKSFLPMPMVRSRE